MSERTQLLIDLLEYCQSHSFLFKNSKLKAESNLLSTAP